MADLVQSFGRADVSEITSEIPRSQFSEEKIEQLADLILQSGGVIRPLVLRQAGLDSYVVLDGHLEYYAAVRAREKDARRGEMVNAFIISKGDEDAILNQIASLDEATSRTDSDGGISSDSTSANSRQQSNAFEHKYTNYEARLNNTETRLNTFQEDQREALRDLKNRFQKLETAIITKPENLLDKLNTSNQAKLEYLFQRYSVSSAKKSARLVHEARQKKDNQEFISYLDVVESTKGFGTTSMLTLMNNWELYS
ncbi:MAG: hypothetical protein ACFB5Z_00475 [Elainellaceae cyanobacterium]